MNINQIIDVLYDGALFFNKNRSKSEIEYGKIRANKINNLLERKVFSEKFINALESSKPYSELESCYQFITNTIIERNPTLKSLCNEVFVIVTNGINFRTDLIDNIPFIVLEFPLIKYINLLNSNVLCSKNFNSLKEDSIYVVDSFLEKYKFREDHNVFETIYSLDSFDNIKYQQLMLIEQIQTVFMIGHEIGHITNPNLTGIDSELTADLVGLDSLKAYVLENSKLNYYIIISIMLLFSYLTLLDVVQKDKKQKKIATREYWLDRYDAILNNLESFKLTEKENILITGYDKICNVIDDIIKENIDTCNY
ncbi:hypothetical protein [Eubacterium coprostanoligenes]|uniref:hypothetical protein n=1 Tax=Eubacterium coprostanoligenes TaxID=290054 RepID=UPI0023575B0F|nr:hypothetical protein [Eubacterium coprostanoligenes]MCI6254055.1 hypothetical protein [Eubacterium coprostanoligenes]MDY5399822.1 hypothetical protein [Eubacterium coprostanoligenes]